MKTMRYPRLGALAATAMLIVAACGDDEGDAATAVPAEDESPPVATPAPVDSSPVPGEGGPDGGGEEVEATPVPEE